MNEQMQKCSLCGSQATIVFRGLKGYMEGQLFDIYECQKCEASFVSPLVSDKKLYDSIYSYGEKMPGYERYFRYSKIVKKFRNPLLMLSNAENVYWSVKEALGKYFQNKNVSILEIGSGLGYLTYSLNKAGYKTKGLDISREAVAEAKKKYGDYYEAGDLFDFQLSRRSSYDCVIMTEIIEHVENPKKFIEAAASLLKPKGRLILTTPNKSFAPKGTVWQSDVPPVHLWWLSEKSIADLAESLSKKCEFIDFTNYTKRFYENNEIVSIEQINSSLPRMDENRKILLGYENNSLKSKYFGAKTRYFLSYILRRLKKKNPSPRTSTLCAIIY